MGWLGLDHRPPAGGSGELAKIVNWAESTGIKVDKYGEYDEDKMVKEIDDVLRTVIGVAVHYKLVDKVAASIAHHHGRYVQMGFIGAANPVEQRTGAIHGPLM